jgi:Bacterial toxin YdaS
MRTHARFIRSIMPPPGRRPGASVERQCSTQARLAQVPLARLIEPCYIDGAMRDPALQAAIASCGSVQALANVLGVRRQAVSGWGRCPAERVLQVERASGVSREWLRPDLYQPLNGGADDDRLIARPDEMKTEKNVERGDTCQSGVAAGETATPYGGEDANGRGK